MKAAISRLTSCLNGARALGMAAGHRPEKLIIDLLGGRAGRRCY